MGVRRGAGGGLSHAAMHGVPPLAKRSQVVAEAVLAKAKASADRRATIVLALGRVGGFT